MTAAILDAGALIAIERGARRVNDVLTRLARDQATVIVPSSVLAQVWRDGARQARLGRFRRIDHVVSTPLDDDTAIAVGQLLARSGTSDVVDAHVVVEARRSKAIVVVTSDPDDLRALDPSLRLIGV